eukprot:TRINITY_DN1155_c0_g1_i5.p1 TRINITY_DN1155_c0_g1~~TRINITY_DN1155_c0_g1_i5.p1  ORF type:complete len:1150 (-),score=202.79 TRINITY_DN1155_c0_g1_i5:25-3474(-)
MAPSDTPAPETTADGGSSPDAALARLHELGYPASLCLVAYKHAGGDINLAGAWLGSEGEQYIKNNPQYFHSDGSASGRSSSGSGEAPAVPVAIQEANNVMTDHTSTPMASTTRTVDSTDKGSVHSDDRTLETVPQQELAMVLQAGLAPRTLVWGHIPAYLIPQYTTAMTSTHRYPTVPKYSQINSGTPIPSLLLSHLSWSQVWSAGDVGVGLTPAGASGDSSVIDTGEARPWHWDRVGLGCLLEPLPSPIVQVAVADEGCTLVCGNGHAYRLASKADGQVGYPVKIQALQQFHVIQAAAGARHTVYLSIDGLVFAAGRNNLCQLGFAPESYTSTQEEGPYLVYQLPRIQHLAAGPSYTLALAFNGDVYIWGAMQPEVEPSDLMYIPEPRLLWSSGSGLVQALYPSLSCIYVHYHTGQVQVAHFDQEMIDAAVQGDLVLSLRAVLGLQNMHIQQLAVSSTRACALTIDGQVMERKDGVFHPTPLTRTATRINAYRHFLQVQVQAPTRQTHIQRMWNLAHSAAGGDGAGDTDAVLQPFEVYFHSPADNQRVGIHRLILAAACPGLLPLLPGEGEGLAHTITHVSSQDGILLLHLHDSVSWQHVSLLITWLYADGDVALDEHAVTHALRTYGLTMDTAVWQRIGDLARRLLRDHSLATAALNAIRRCWAHLEYTRTVQGRERVVPTRQQRLQRWPDAGAAAILGDDVTVPAEARLQQAAPLTLDAPRAPVRTVPQPAAGDNIWAGLGDGPGLAAADDPGDEGEEFGSEDEFEEDPRHYRYQQGRRAPIGAGGAQGFGFGAPSAAWERAHGGRRGQVPIQAIHQRLGKGDGAEGTGVDDEGDADDHDGSPDVGARHKALQAALKRLEGASSPSESTVSTSENPAQPKGKGRAGGSTIDRSEQEDPSSPPPSAPGQGKGKGRASVANGSSDSIDPHRQARINALAKLQQGRVDISKIGKDGGHSSSSGGGVAAGKIVPVPDLPLSPSDPWTDVLLCCESGEEIACHALVVTACPYIRMAIQHHRNHTSGDSNDDTNGMIRIALPTVVGGEAAGTLLTFLYTGQLEVTFSQLMTYIACADVLQLSEAKALLCDVLLQDMNKIETGVLLDIVPGVLRFNMAMVAQQMYTQLQLAHRPGGRASSQQLAELAHYIKSK